MAAVPSASSSLEDLRDDLSLNQAILESLGNREENQREREEVSRKIKTLQDQIDKMQPPLPNWGSPTTTPSSSNRQPNYNYNANLPYMTNPVASFNQMPFVSPSQSMNLPSRKRVRNEFDDEFDSLNIPESKSLRTPTTASRASPARSVDSLDTDFSDDPILRKILGSNWIEEKRTSEQFMKEFEAKRRQEEEDAEMARQLQESWNQELSQPQQHSQFSSGPSFPTNNYSQSFLRPDGSTFQRPAQSRPQSSIKLERNPGPPNITASGTSTPASDDSGLEEISPDVWTSKFGSTQPRNLPPSLNPGNNFNMDYMSMPGMFPGFQTPYTNVPGTSVYGNSSYGTTQFNSSNSSLGSMPRTFNVFGGSSQHIGAMPGSSRMPFDLDKYPLPPSLSFADPEQTQEEIKDLLKHIRPDEDLTPEQLAEIQPEGLRVNLMPHQRKGFAWMKSMEEGTNKGGILADDMGLGKTVQALALILGRPPLDDEGRRVQRPTLIVAPVALMQQWERETKKMIHRSHHLNVLILHGGNRNMSWTEVRSYDLVLTTYGLLASDLKRKHRWDKHVEQVPDARPTPQQQCPVLGERSRFHRVILDEAQNIKNKNTKAAAAACRVQAEYRWCLSGTPMQNNVDEIYSLIKFCRIRPYNDFEKFSKDIGRPLKSKTVQYGRDKAMQQLQALLRAVLLRRTKKSEIDGQPIIQLPEKNTVEDRALFSADELAFYRALEQQAQIQFNRFLKNGTVGRHYSHALVLLLRLRQCCCSPQLVTNAKDFLVNGALQDLDYVENARYLSKDVIKRLSESDAFECPICMDAVENPIIFNPCGHSLCQECLSTMVDKAMADSESHKVNCPHCRAEIDTNKVTDHESFLRVHFPERPGVKPLDDDNAGGAAESDGGGSDSDSSDEDVEDDNDKGEDLKDFIVPDEDDIEYDTDASESGKKKGVKNENAEEGTKDAPKEQKPPSSNSVLRSIKSNKSRDKSKGKKKKKSKPDVRTLAMLRKEGLRSRAAKKKYLRRLGRGYQSSAKIEKTVSILKDIKDNGEGEKTIIFSSFTSFLDLLEVALNREEDDLGTYTRYDGSMSARDRNEAVMRFTDDSGCKAMLISLKAGNSGLNLTAANHVVILDPFWNPFVEYQAADRCYRIGQSKEVTIHRVLIGEADEDGNAIEVPEGTEKEFTVEDRILRLQEKKKELVETALDETASGNIGRLGVRELGYLFGVNAM